MDNLILKDILRVSDSKIRGLVILRKDDGTVIFKKENMIVEGGRKFIRDLLFNQINNGILDTRKIVSVKFGCGSTTTAPDTTDLTGKIDGEYLYKYDLNTTDLVWTQYTDPYSSGGTSPLPINSETNDKFIDTVLEKIFTFDGTDWDLGEDIDFESEDPEIGTEGDFYFNTANSKLYIVEKVVVLIPEHLGIGIKLNIILEGSSSYEATSELGLFLNSDSETLFSRVVFDPIPITAGFKYRLTYYIYF